MSPDLESASVLDANNAFQNHRCGEQVARIKSRDVLLRIVENQKVETPLLFITNKKGLARARPLLITLHGFNWRYLDSVRTDVAFEEFYI